MILVDRGLIETRCPTGALFNRLPHGRRRSVSRHHRAHAAQPFVRLAGYAFSQCLTVIPFHGYAASFGTRAGSRTPAARTGRDGCLLQRRLHPDRTAGRCGDRSILHRLRQAGNPGTPGDAATVASPWNPLTPAVCPRPGSRRPAQSPREYVNIYASGLFSTPSDMGRLAMLFLNGGRLGDRRIPLHARSRGRDGAGPDRELPFNPITDHPVHLASAAGRRSPKADWRRSG